MEPREKEIYRVTLIGSAVNLVLIVIKFAAGIVGRSSALVADAAHSLSDFISDVVVLVFVKIAGKPRDKSHDYGHGKFETLATLIIGLILVLAGIGLLINGVELVIGSFRGNQLPRPAPIALIVALISIISKEWLFRYTMARGKALDSPALKANAWHHRSDAVSSGGTLIGIAGAIFLGDRWRILDPIAAIIVSFLIIKSGIDIMRPCISELLEASLPEDEEDEIKRIVTGIDGIYNVHNLRTRRIGNSVAIDIHARMDGDEPLRDAHTKATAAERALRERFGKNAFVNIHIEPYQENERHANP